LLPLFLFDPLLLLLDFFCLLDDDEDELELDVAPGGSGGRIDAFCECPSSFSGDDGESLELVS
jgi:hypothetical protein